MRVQDALQDGPRAGHADARELGAQEVDGAAVERVERVSAHDGALFYERFLGREERCVELALGRGERAVYGEGACCANANANGWVSERPGQRGGRSSQISEAYPLRDIDRVSYSYVYCTAVIIIMGHCVLVFPAGVDEHQLPIA